MDRRAKTVLTAPQDLLDRRAREALSAPVFAALKGDLANLLTMASGSGKSAALGDVAGVVLQHMGDAQSLRSLVHLSELNKPMHALSWRGDPQARDGVQTWVAMANAREVCHDLPRAPLAVNEVADALRKPMPAPGKRR